jgi:phosphate/sulfate permease
MGALLLLILIVMTLIALTGAPHGKKLRTFAIVFAWVLAGFAVGIGIGAAFNNPQLAAELGMSVGAVAAITKANNERRKNKKLANISDKLS